MSNWNQVCNAGVLCAALAIADEEPELARQIIAGARASIPRGMTVYAPDGEHPEGPGYWTFGTTYTVIALAALESALGNDLDLSNAPGFARTTDFPIIVQGPSGRAFNFADCTEDEQNSPARAWLAHRFSRPTAMRATRALLDESLRLEKITPFDPKIQGQVVNRFFPLHAVWFPAEPATSDGSDMPLDTHLRGVADLAIFRSSWTDPRALYVGFKAGENAYRHNHLDLGSFVLDADGVRWATDLGPDVYELPGIFDYKGTARWEFFRINNRSHNTVTPGDALQRRKVTAPITTFVSTPAKAFAIANLAPAYPDEAKSLLRGIALLDRKRVLVQDEFTPTRPAIPLRWIMMTRATISLDESGRTATLSLEGRTLKAELLTPSNARFTIQSATPPTAAENQKLGLRPSDHRLHTRFFRHSDTPRSPLHARFCREQRRALTGFATADGLEVTTSV
ncbi:MAG: heparinase II/III family protein [Nibricoccus sp.]